MKSIISSLSEKGLLVSPDLSIPESEENAFLDFVNRKMQKETVLFVDGKIYNDFKGIFHSKPATIQAGNKTEMSREDIPFGVDILHQYKFSYKKTNIEDFYSYYSNRFNEIRQILSSKPDLADAVPLSRVFSSQEKEKISTIGMVIDCKLTKSDNFMINLEDPTGTLMILVSKKAENFSVCEEIVPDEIIGVRGIKSGRYFYADEIFFPDIKSITEKEGTKEEVYSAFISDLHIGSKMFLENEFDYFIKWIRGEAGNESQKNLSSKIKYLFITGDLVDGVGVYPSQEKELNILDIYKQYEKCAEFLEKIPDSVIKIICPGNHDAVRLCEPQPEIPSEYIKRIKAIPNLISTSNPSTLNIHHFDGFEGYKVLMYHGYSFCHFADTIAKIRNAGGVDRPDLIMKFILKKRHLSPIYSSNLLAPTEVDDLIIRTVPDIFASGHLHKARISNYKHVLTIASSCFQARTSFEEKLGLHPEPAHVPIFNMKTKKTSMMKFI